MGLVIASNEDEVTLYTLKRRYNLLIVARERVHKAQFFWIALSMAARRPVEPAFIRINAHISCLQDQIDLFTSLALPTGAELEAEMEITVQIGKNCNIDKKFPPCHCVLRR